MGPTSGASGEGCPGKRHPTLLCEAAGSLRVVKAGQEQGKKQILKATGGF